MKLHLTQIWDLANRFVPAIAADRRLHDSGPNSWWPAHEIGHFLVATAAECSAPRFGIDTYVGELDPACIVRGTEAVLRYVITKEIAATSISQRLLRRSGHATLADEEIQYTDETTLECSFERWCKRSVDRILRVNSAMRLPTTRQGLETRLVRKAREVGTPYVARRRPVTTKAHNVST